MVDFSSLATRIFGESETSEARLFELGAGVTESFAVFSNAIANRRSARVRSSVLRADAQNIRRTAKLARREGRQAAQQVQAETAQLIGRQRAALAANGFVLDEGTALDLVIETAGLGALDAVTAIANAERRAAQLINESRAAEFKAGLQEQSADQSLLGGISAVGSILTGTARNLDRISKMENGT